MWYASLLLLFLLGSVPTSLIVASLWHDTDPRVQGSGNIGMTNIWRILGFEAAVLTLMGDLGKGTLGIYMMKSICDEPFSLGVAAAALVIGHCYSGFLQFRGGKGVATTAGVLLAINHTVFLVICTVWITARITTKKSSISALISAIVLIPLCYFIAAEYIWTAIFLVSLIAWRHKDNISRLREGGE